MAEERNIYDVLGEMNAGVFIQQVEAVMKEAALAVINHGDKSKKGKVVLTFGIERFGKETSGMVLMSSSWEFKIPTRNGMQTEKNTTDMPFCVSPTGVLSVYPLSQEDMFGSEDKGSTVTQLRKVER